MQPLGWRDAAATEPVANARPGTAWVGRPVRREGIEISGLDVLVPAARRWARLAEVVLIGERLEPAALALRRSGVTCRTPGLAPCPFEQAPA